MYCEDSEGTDIDHHRPKSAFPEHCFRWPNYLLACSHCNSNEKRTQYPLDSRGQPFLLDPSVDDPYAHIAFVPELGRFEGVTKRGKRTVKVFGLNRRENLEIGRRDTWTVMSALLRDYARARTAHDVRWQSRVKEAIQDLSFQSVVQPFIRDALNGQETVAPSVSALVKATQEEWEWAL